MHWEFHNFDLPDLPSDKEWKVFVDTSEDVVTTIERPEPTEKVKKQLEKKSMTVKPRSIVVLISSKREEKDNIDEA